MPNCPPPIFAFYQSSTDGPQLPTNPGVVRRKDARLVQRYCQCLVLAPEARPSATEVLFLVGGSGKGHVSLLKYTSEMS